MGQLPYLFAQSFPENIESFDTRTLQRLLDTLATRPSDLQKWSHKGQGSWVEQSLAWRAENAKGQRASPPPHRLAFPSPRLSFLVCKISELTGVLLGLFTL